MSIDRVTKIQTGHRTVQSFAAHGDEAGSEATLSEAATGVGAAACALNGTNSVRENEKDVLTEKFVQHNGTETGMQYCVQVHG